MAEMRCPMCSRPNPDDLEFCQFCDARLKPLMGSSQENPHHIHAGEKPTKKQTSEFEKVKFGGSPPIRSGEQPTKKDTGELERALPSWLKSLRESGDQPPAEPAADPGKTDELKAAPKDEFAGESPDWLKGLESASEEDETEFPDWLAGLRSASAGEPEAATPAASPPKETHVEPDWLSRLGGDAGKPPAAPPEKTAELTPDWLSRLGAEVEKAPPVETARLKPEAINPPPEAMPPAIPAENVPDWLEALKSKGGKFEETPAEGTDNAPDWLSSLPTVPAVEPSAAAPGIEPDWLKGFKETAGASGAADLPAQPTPESETPDWLKNLKGMSQAQEGAGTPAQPTPAGETPDWLNKLKPVAPSQEGAGILAQPTPESETPDWLKNLKGISPVQGGTGAPAQPTPAGETPDWLNNLKAAALTQEGAGTSAQPTPEAETPDWLNKLKGMALAPEPGETPAQGAPAAETPDWLSSLSAKSSAAGSSAFIGEPPAAREAAGEVPSWLSQLQSDVSEASKVEKRAEEFESAGEPLPVEKSSEPAPDWLSGIEPATAPSEGTPALVMPDGQRSSPEQGKGAFSLETPDWLSKLRPERSAETPGSTPDEPDGGSLETAELPSWVQAMRPVEAVVSDASAAPEEMGTAEASGPLAGLHSVLPSGPMQGSMRKPPAYAVKLQVSNNQQRYAAQLEKMVMEEGQARAQKPERMISNQMWRLVISVVLIGAVLLPLLTGTAFTPDMKLYPSEWGETSRLLDELPVGAPLLLVFDYDPALSGELEASAAPIIDHILYRGARLALVSTSPTGPALAGQFLESTQKYHLETGLQYTNLGYLAGGPAGIQLFASDPGTAVATNVEGDPAWETPALLGVTRLSDFAALLVITDNADTGRLWIEQTASAIGSTPILMIISAQAEPMIRPYYDSGQVKGLVTGLAGGKAYEQTYDTPGLARRYWDSFGSGTLAAVLLIAIGSTLGALSARRTRRKR